VVEVLYVRGKLGAKIVSNLNLVKKHLTQIFIHLKVNELREEKWLGRSWWRVWQTDGGI